MMKLRAAVVCLVVIFGVMDTAGASQAPGHVWAALGVRDGLPADLRKLVDDDLSSYLLGAAGPDIAYTTHYVQVAAGIFAPGTESHGDDPKSEPKTGDLTVNMLRLAQQHNDEKEIAFALGWLTHYCVDSIIHPLVNNHGGYYPVKEESLRHKHLEMLECEHVFQKGGVKTHHLYVMDLGPNKQNVPAALVTEAFALTFPAGANAKAYKPSVKKIAQYGAPPIEETKPPAFTADFMGSAENMRVLTESMLAVHQGKFYGLWGGLEFAFAVKGPPPKPDEYKRLMEPLRISSATIQEIGASDPEDADGFLIVDYTMNDLRLMKLFCDEWGQVMPRAIDYSMHCIQQWHADPGKFKLPNVDLNVGLIPYDPKKVKPRKIDLDSVCVGINMTDTSGKSVDLFMPEHYPAFYKLWGRVDHFVWCPVCDYAPQTMVDKWKRVVGTRSTGKIWGGRAGQCYVKVPFKTDDAGPFDTTVTVSCDNIETVEPYGVSETWTGRLGPISSKRAEQPEDIPELPEVEPELGKEAVQQLQKLKPATLSGTIRFKHDESHHKDLLTQGELGPITIKIRPNSDDEADFEVDLTVTIINKLETRPGNVTSVNKAELKGKGQRLGQGFWKFRASGVYEDHVKSPASEYTREGSIVVGLDLDMDKPIEGWVAGISPYADYVFKAAMKK